MEKLALGILLLLVILIAISYGVWRIAKNIGVAPKFRIYLIGIVVFIVISTYLSFCISNLTDNKNSDTDSKEEVIIEL